MGRGCLVLDLMEAFRLVVADRGALSLVNQGGAG
ncbi:MAG: CRISPR-associated endonuclease Cas1 [Magnetospiraceae bacterium]